MYEIIVVCSSALFFASAIDYVRCAWTEKTKPVPATWILMMTTMSLSFWMYWNSPNKSWTGNIGVTAGLMANFIIFSGVILKHIKNNTLHIMFDTVQKCCLAGGFSTVIVWIITKDPLLSYVLVQGIAVIGYFATIKRLWRAPSSTEPMFLWIAVVFANLLALYPAFIKDDVFSWIYLSRTIPSSIFMVYLIKKINRRSIQNNFSSELS